MPSAPATHNAISRGSRDALKRDAARHYNKHSREGQAFYSSPQWRAARAWHVRQNPLCVECRAQGKAKAVDVVDHIIEIKDGGAKLSADNLQSLCHAHHNAKSARERAQRAIQI